MDGFQKINDQFIKIRLMKKGILHKFKIPFFFAFRWEWCILKDTCYLEKSQPLNPKNTKEGTGCPVPSDAY